MAVAGQTMIDQVVSHYKIIERVGAGGMGEVFKAEDLKLGRPVALKFLPVDLVSDDQAVKRFLWEARSLSSLNHPNICTVYEVDEHEGRPYIVMEFLEGQQLGPFIHGTPVKADVLVDLAIQLTDALDAAHSRGLLHRDIKPANIVVTRRGQIKVLDFGLAKLAHDVQSREDVMAAGGVPKRAMTTTPGVTMGTIAYMSPEQARGEDLDARSDLFSLGLVLYEMATGRQTFAGHTTAVIFDAILNRDPIPPGELNPELPAELDRIITRTIEKDRDLRYQSASDLRGDLQRLKREMAAGRPIASSGALRALKSGPRAIATPSAVQADVTPPTGAVAAQPAAAPPAAAASAPDAGSAAPAGAVAMKAAAARTGGFRRPMPLGVLVAIGVVLGLAAAAAWWLLTSPTPMGRPSAPASADVAPVAPEQPPQEADVTQPPARDAVQAAAQPVIPRAAQAAVDEQHRPAVVPKTAAGGSRRASARGVTGDSKPASAPERTAAPKPDAAEEEAARELSAIRASVDARQFEAALPALTAFLGRHSAGPLAADALMLVGRTQEGLKQPAKAMATYTEIRERFSRFPQVAEATFRLAALIAAGGEKGREQDVLNLLSEVVTRYPASAVAPQALFMRAEQLDRLKLRAVDESLGVMAPASLASYRSVADRYPDVALAEHALYRLANMYDELRRYDLEADALERLGSRFPESRYDPWFRAGELYERRLKDRDKALAAFARVPPSSPRYRDAQRKIK